MSDFVVMLSFELRGSKRCDSLYLQSEVQTLCFEICRMPCVWGDVIYVDWRKLGARPLKIDSMRLLSEVKWCFWDAAETLRSA